LLSLSSTDPATPAIYTLSLHDALPISPVVRDNFDADPCLVQVLQDAHHLAMVKAVRRQDGHLATLGPRGRVARKAHRRRRLGDRSEEHTSELQSRENLVCRLLLEKKKQ